MAHEHLHLCSGRVNEGIEPVRNNALEVRSPRDHAFRGQRPSRNQASDAGPRGDRICPGGLDAEVLETPLHRIDGWVRCVEARLHHDPARTHRIDTQIEARAGARAFDGSIDAIALGRVFGDRRDVVGRRIPDLRRTQVSCVIGAMSPSPTKT